MQITKLFFNKWSIWRISEARIIPLNACSVISMLSVFMLSCYPMYTFNTQLHAIYVSVWQCLWIVFLSLNTIRLIDISLYEEFMADGFLSCCSEYIQNTDKILKGWYWYKMSWDRPCLYCKLPSYSFNKWSISGISPGGHSNVKGGIRLVQKIT